MAMDNQFSGQTSDGGGKDALVGQSGMQIDPYRARAGDFPVKSVTPEHGQGGSHGTAEGDGMLASEAENQCGPRYVEDGGKGSSGAGTPTEWNSGGRSARVASAFPVETNRGESSSAGTSVPLMESVNLATGLIESKGYKMTRMKETPEAAVKIPA